MRIWIFFFYIGEITEIKCYGFPFGIIMWDFSNRTKYFVCYPIHTDEFGNVSSIIDCKKKTMNTLDINHLL